MNYLQCVVSLKNVTQSFVFVFAGKYYVNSYFRLLLLGICCVVVVTIRPLHSERLFPLTLTSEG